MTRPKSWHPFEDIVDLQADVINTVMDQVAQNMFRGARQQGLYAHRMMVDLNETSEGYTLSAALPGLHTDDVHIDFADGVLTIKAEAKEPQLAPDTRQHLHERFYGTYERSFRFPTPINTEAIEAHYENGVLNLWLPRAELVKSRRIHVKKPA
jgi:HSP20 family protein